MATQFLDMSDVRQRLSELLGKLTDPIYITVYGKPSAVIVSYETYEGVLARVEDLEDSLWMFCCARTSQPSISRPL